MSPLKTDSILRLREGESLTAYFPWFGVMLPRVEEKVVTTPFQHSCSAYTGEGTEFDEGIAEFAMAYADQTERDWRAFVDAIKADRISASTPGLSQEDPAPSFEPPKELPLDHLALF